MFEATAAAAAGPVAEEGATALIHEAAELVAPAGCALVERCARERMDDPQIKRPLLSLHLCCRAYRNDTL